jgi:hypothetical protein
MLGPAGLRGANPGLVNSKFIPSIAAGRRLFPTQLRRLKWHPTALGRHVLDEHNSR